MVEFSDVGKSRSMSPLVPGGLDLAGRAAAGRRDPDRNLPQPETRPASTSGSARGAGGLCVSAFDAPGALVSAAFVCLDTALGVWVDSAMNLSQLLNRAISLLG